MIKVFISNSCLSLVLLFLPGVIVGALFLYLSTKFDSTQIQFFISSYGYGTVFVFIGIFIFRTILVFAPYYMMLVIGGVLFGPKLGIMYNFIAAFFSASLSFWFSRLIRMNTVGNRMKEKNKKIISEIEKHGFTIILLMRLSIIFPFDIINYLVGFTKMPYRDFILGNMFGIIPEVLVLSLVGSLAIKPQTMQFYGACFSLFSISLILFLYKKNIKNYIQYILKDNHIFNE